MVGGGGGGGGGSQASNDGGRGGGGGGGGGSVYVRTNVTVTPGTAYTVAVGAGGAGGAANNTNGGFGSAGNSGTASQISGSGFSTLTASGGGGGTAQTGTSSWNTGGDGGSTPGAAFGATTSRSGGANDWEGGGGGAGANANGSNGVDIGGKGGNGGNGGAGFSSNLTGSSVVYGGGGGGGGQPSSSLSGTAGSGGSGGGGAGGIYATSPAAGTDGFGGGGGGGGGWHNSSYPARSGARGGDGFVLVRYVLPTVTEPDLWTSHDTGTSSSDNVTNRTSSNFSGAAQPGAVVQLSTAPAGTNPSSGGWTNTGSTCTADATSGAWTCTTGNLAAGTYAVRATATITLTGLTTVTQTSATALALTIDTAVPTVSFTAPTTPSLSRTLTYTATFSRAVSGIAASDFTIGSGTATGCTISPSATSASSPSFAITVTVTCTSDGTVALTLLANQVVDTVTNTGPPSNTAASTVTIATIIGVTYDTQGGSSISSGTTLIGGSIALSPGTPTRTGYTFKGWFVADSGGSAITFPYTHGQTAGFTLYAQWTANTLTVTYDVRGGSGSVADGSTTTGGSMPSLPSGAGLSRRGYSFDGWAASIGGAKLSTPFVHGQSANFTLFARWAPDSLTVTYSLAGGTGPSGFSSTVTTSTGGSLSSPGTPTRDRFDFVGWSPLAAGSPVVFPYVHNRTSDFTMYAVWRSSGEPNNVWFYPGAGPSNVMTVTAPTVLTPGFPRSSELYTLTATVQTPLGVSGLDRVTMCWYKTGTGGGTSACANASTSPETEFLVTWTEAEDTFSKTGTNHYALGTEAEASAAAPTGFNVSVVFKFRVSNAMRAGSWAVLVTAIDDAGQSRSESANATVNSFFTVMSRPVKRFGVLPRSGSTTVNDTLVGEYATNANADFSILATDFNCAGCDPADALTLKTSGDPGPGEVALDCDIGSTLTDPLRVTGSTKKFGRALTETGETTNKNNKMSCRLTYGGGAKRALVEYSNTVTFAIGNR